MELNLKWVVSMRHAIGTVLRGTRSTTLTILSVLAIAVGVPLLWVWIASQLAGDSREVTPSLALVITIGILLSYWVVFLVGMWLRSRWVSEADDRARARRMSWNRSFRDEPYRAGDHRSDPIELVFVATAVIGVITFEIWFFFFAGSPLPNQPLF